MRSRNPGRTGRGLVVSIAVAAFVLGVLVRNVTVWRPGRILPLTSVAVVLAGSGVLMWLQPNGPGAEGVLVGVLFAVRWLPERAAVPALIVAFVAVEIIAWPTSRSSAASRCPPRSAPSTGCCSSRTASARRTSRPRCWSPS
jgi:hypothetical protein